jgi:sugar O-acyltransferase (sialic acid O-acetyltransferase NeuD family)
MPKLLVVGAGGHGKVVADTAYEEGRWDKIAFLDDRYPKLNVSLLWPVLGKLEQAQVFLKEYSDVAVAVGNNRLRVELIDRFSKVGFLLPAIVHPSAFVSRSAVIGAGSVLFAQAAVNAGAKIGIGSIVNTGATIDHDCIVADGVHISPGAHLAGTVKVGKCSWLGIGCSVIQQLSIGENVLVGAGAVIIKNVPNNVTIVGIPGKIVRRHGTLEE